jgi:DNA-binding CsgD family transcriptional regulator/tetratricopeptide (TPR) repeat protein/energy-coupling factor transporter ATP-binding protein EcfA2
MLERDTELAVLGAALAAATTGRGSMVVVAGEAGIGKTTLIKAFRQLVPVRARVLAGACDDLLAPPTLGPLREAVRRRPGPLADALAGGDPEQVFGGVVDELSGPAPTVLIVEDLHWADDATIDVLRYLVRRLDALPAVLVVSLRDDTTGHSDRLTRLLAATAAAGGPRLDLRPLSADAVTALAAPAGRAGDDLVQLTGGNPFYVTEVLAGPPGSVPTTVAATVLARLQGLGADARRGLEQLSVLCGTIELPLAAELLGDGFAGLVEAEQSGMIEIGSDHLTFRHELARRAIEANVPGLRRQAHHRAVVGVLAMRSPVDLPRLVHHAVLAGDAETVIAAAPEAARAAARAGSSRQARRLFEAVLRYGDRLPEADRARLLDEYGWELYNAHRFTDAVLAGRRAVTLYQGLDEPVACGEALLRLSRHVYMTGDTEAAVRAVEQAIALLEPLLPAPELAHAYAQQGALQALVGASEQAVATLTRARALAEQAERPDLVALALNYLGTAVCELEGSLGLVHLRDSLAVALAAGAHEYAARAYTNLGELLYRFGRFDELERCVTEGLAFTRERGFWSHAYNLEVHRCLLLVRGGRWAEAETALRALVERVDEPGMLFVYSAPPLARLLARRGSPEAGPLLELAWERAVRQQTVLGIAYAGTAYVEWAWLHGRRERVAEVADVVRRATRSPGCLPLRAEFLRYLRRIVPGADWDGAAVAPVPPGDRYEHALALGDSGKEDAMQEALRLLDQLGAAPAASRVRQRMRHLGIERIPRGPRPATRANRAGLTPRQLDVLGLVADGLTNSEIADRLVLSVRTVDHHVTAVLDKLEVPTRRHAAIAFRR